MVGRRRAGRIDLNTSFVAPGSSCSSADRARSTGLNHSPGRLETCSEVGEGMRRTWR